MDPSLFVEVGHPTTHGEAGRPIHHPGSSMAAPAEGSMVLLRGSKSRVSKGEWKTNQKKLGSSERDSNLNLPILGSLAQHEYSALANEAVRESHQGKVLTIEGVLVPSPREQYLVRPEHEGVCSLCSIGVDVKHTDVLILSQFLRADGCMLPRRVTGLCKNQQKRISILVQMAQKAGLMPNLGPANSKKDPKLRYRWKKFNTYFDESTIKPFRYQNVEKSAAVQIQSF
uniref:Mitochondrial ribosomal protein S18A n=1 Tax=Timema cristinae TaxID=61476 RepID=A0A7R9GR21_TIMCR|nr:unnamed protein product [Timema cristinae]